MQLLINILGTLSIVVTVILIAIMGYYLINR